MNQREQLGDPPLSVVTVARNNESGLRRTAESVLSQSTGDEFEWIVVDGASTDGSEAFLRALRDSRVTWTSEHDEGIYDAMNRGLRRSSGEFVQFLNAGDIYSHPDALQLVQTTCRSHSADSPLIAFGATLVGQSGNRRQRKAYPASYIRHGLPCVHQAMIYPRARALAVGGYNTTYRCCGDYDLTARMMVDGVGYRKYPNVVVDFELGGFSSQNFSTLDREARHVQATVLGLGRGQRSASSALRHLTRRRPARRETDVRRGVRR